MYHMILTLLLSVNSYYGITALNTSACVCIHLHIATGQTLRCDVFVDMISHIEITTHTRELLQEEEPDRFEIQAFDDEGR